MKNLISERVKSIKSSPTLVMTDMASKMKAQGEDVISLSAGEPDFQTPAHICEAAIDAVQKGHTKYTDVGGIKSLRQAIANKFQRENNLQYSADDILVSCGGKHSIFNLIMATINPGDEVIIPAPYWVSYPDMVQLAGGVPVIIPSNEIDFKINAEQLKNAITPNTKLFLINSPSNPSGMMYSRKELSAFASVLLDAKHVIIATDDIYENIIWQEKSFVNILNVCPELHSRTIVINGISKAYSMTGWRIGYAAGNSEIIKSMKKIQSQSTSNPTSISQYAAIAAIDGDPSCTKEMLAKFKERHDFIIPEINKIHGMNVKANNGTFYAFIKVDSLIKELNLADDVALSMYILEKAKVSVVAGSSFGMSGFIRISYASSIETLQNALERLAKLFGTK